MYKPMLAPNKQKPLSELPYPLMASHKLDGIRCIFREGQMLTRSLKQVPNQFLQDLYAEIKQLSLDLDITIDGEIYSHSNTFQQIYSDVMTKYKCEVAPDLEFRCFDVLDNKNPVEPFDFRWLRYGELARTNPKIVPITQHIVTELGQVNFWFKQALDSGYEGLILKHPHSIYKCGRATLREGTMFKIKPWETFDGQIVAVNPATRVNQDVEKTTNELGRSVTSKKLVDRYTIAMASTFTTLYKGATVDVTLTGTEAERVEIWKNQDLYITKWFTYKGMLVGAKDVPRHPVFMHLRDEKESENEL